MEEPTTQESKRLKGFYWALLILIPLLFMFAAFSCKGGGAWAGLVFIATLIIFGIGLVIIWFYFFTAKKIAEKSSQENYKRNMLLFYYPILFISILLFWLAYTKGIGGSFFWLSIILFPLSMFLILRTKFSIINIFTCLLIIGVLSYVAFITLNDCNHFLASEGGLGEAHQCWSEKALETNNPAVCEQISCEVNSIIKYKRFYCEDEDPKRMNNVIRNCYLNINEERKIEDIIHPLLKDDFYYDLAMNVEGKGSCNIVWNPDAPEDCYEKERAKINLSICFLIQDSEIKDTCIRMVAMEVAKTTLDISYCDLVGEYSFKQCKNDVYLGLAMKENDPDFCTKIRGNPSKVSECYDHFEQLYANLTLTDFGFRYCENFIEQGFYGSCTDDVRAFESGNCEAVINIGLKEDCLGNINS